MDEGKFDEEKFQKFMYEKVFRGASDRPLVVSRRMAEWLDEHIHCKENLKKALAEEEKEQLKKKMGLPKPLPGFYPTPDGKNLLMLYERFARPASTVYNPPKGSPESSQKT